MKPDSRTTPIRKYMKIGKPGRILHKDMAEMAGVTPAVITRILQADDRKYVVEEVGHGKIQIWEKLPAPWRKVETKDSAPAKYRSNG